MAEREAFELEAYCRRERSRSLRPKSRPAATGGESGIRTHVRVSPKHAFQACAFSHSAISPCLRGFAPKLITRLGRPRMCFSDFIRERRYLHNVSPCTVSWYTHAFKWLPSESPTQSELKDTVLRMRERGLKETGCNA